MPGQTLLPVLAPQLGQNLISDVVPSPHFKHFFKGGTKSTATAIKGTGTGDTNSISATGLPTEDSERAVGAVDEPDEMAKCLVELGAPLRQ